MVISTLQTFHQKAATLILITSTRAGQNQFYQIIFYPLIKNVSLCLFYLLTVETGYFYRLGAACVYNIVMKFFIPNHFDRAMTETMIFSPLNSCQVINFIELSIRNFDLLTYLSNLYTYLSLLPS